MPTPQRKRSAPVLRVVQAGSHVLPNRRSGAAGVPSVDMWPEKQHGREIHVGLDAWNLAPVSIDTIAELIAPASGP